jgi:response regulator RpfG family c-di-GMP phosphodiesterase
MKEIIIVDDSRADVEQARQALIKAGLKNPVRVFESGEKALDYLGSVPEPPAMIFLDVKLPGITGFDVLDSLRVKSDFDTVLRVVFSTLEDIPTIKEAYARGAHTFLVKPVNKVDVVALLKSFQHCFRADS